MRVYGKAKFQGVNLEAEVGIIWEIHLQPSGGLFGEAVPATASTSALIRKEFDIA